MFCTIGIGSNIDPKTNIKKAIELIEKEYQLTKISTAYQNPAEQFLGADFINLAVLINSDLLLPELIYSIKQIEKIIDPNNRPLQNRKIDLDLLTFGNIISIEHNIPHKDISKFSFCACPLAELIPQKIHPRFQQTYRSIGENHKDKANLTAIDNFW